MTKCATALTETDESSSGCSDSQNASTNDLLSAVYVQCTVTIDRWIGPDGIHAYFGTSTDPK